MIISYFYKKEFLLFIFFYLSLYFTFVIEDYETLKYLKEGSIDKFYHRLLQHIGPFSDFFMRETIIENFNKDFNYTFYNYEKFSDRHSPFLLIYLSLYRKLGIDFDTIRLIHINILPLTSWVFYKCLKIKFPEVKKSLLFILSLYFFLSPTMRSLSIWPDSRIYGFLFFLISVFYFLKFNSEKKYIYAIYNTFFLCLSSYISPNFAIFFLLFFFNFITYYQFSKKTFLLLLINFIMAIPAYYYLFELDVFFISTTAIPSVPLSTRLNIANKILIISSLILFYFVPFLTNKKIMLKLYNEIIKINKIFFSFIITFSLAIFFSYEKTFTGGGIFFQFSQLIFQNNFLFFLISLVSILFVMFLWNISLNNKIIIFILFASTPQLTIYHKYFDPLLIVLFLLLFDLKFDQKKIITSGFVKLLYLFSIIFLFLNYFKLLINS